MISFTFLLNPLRSTYLPQAGRSRLSCSNQGGRLSKRRQVLQKCFFARRTNSRKEARQTLLKMILHGERQVKFNSEVYHRRFEGDIATPDLCRISLPVWDKMKRRQLLLLFCYFCHELIAVHPWKNVIIIYIYIHSHYKVWIFNTLGFFLVIPHLFSVSTSLWKTEKGRAILPASATVAATAALRSPTTVSLSVCKV